MPVDREELTEIVKIIVSEVIKQLGIETKNEQLPVVKKEKSGFTSYQKTENLLYSYNDFRKVLVEKRLEIEELEMFGVPKRGDAVHNYLNGNSVQGLVLPEESVQDAIRTVQDSVKHTVQVLSMIENAMSALKDDPYFCILEMRYFEGRTQEDIATTLDCTQQTISNNKTRLVHALALRMFPDETIEELIE